MTGQPCTQGAVQLLGMTRLQVKASPFAPYVTVVACPKADNLTCSRATCRGQALACACVSGHSGRHSSGIGLEAVPVRLGQFCGCCDSGLCCH